MNGRGAAAAALTAGALTAIGAMAPGASSAPSARGAACVPVSNIETIVDDSGSMAITDSHKLRVQGVDLLIDSLPNATTMGAIEFGGSFSTSTPAADTLFPPRAVGPNAAADKAVLKQKVNADNGTTDYNAAFAQAQADNPSAKARIFLTDGGHDAGEYTNGHRGGPPTYVVGFGSSASGSNGAARLQQIASETGGRYFPQTDASKLQSVFDTIAAILTCHSPARAVLRPVQPRGTGSHAQLHRAEGLQAPELRAVLVGPVQSVHPGDRRQRLPRGRGAPARHASLREHVPARDGHRRLEGATEVQRPGAAPRQPPRARRRVITQVTRSRR